LIFFITFACLLSLTRCELTCVSIRGDEDDVVYMKRSDNDTCGGVLHIENNNTFEVTVNIYDGYNSQDLTVPAEDIEDVQLNSSFIQEGNIIIITVSSADETLIKNVSIVHRDVLEDFDITTGSEMYVGEATSFSATVNAPLEVKFVSELTMTDNSWEQALEVITENNVTIKTATFSFIPPHEGNCTVRITVISKCGETISKTIDFIFKERIENFTNYTNDMDKYTLCPSSGIQNLEEVTFKILSPSYNKPWIKDIQSVNQMKNNKMAQVSFTASFESNYTILVEARSNCGENLSQFINITAAFPETILTFKINATKDLQIKELSLIYQEMLSGFNIDYKESMFIDKEYNITASVLSGSNVTMNFSIISPADDNAMTRNQFKRNSDNEKNFQFKFRPILETNYTIHMVAESFCEEVLMQDIKISAVPDWTGDQTTVTQIYLDLTNDDKSGFITVTNDSIEIPIQKSGDTKDFMMIVLSCFQNIKSQSYKTMFQNRIYILDNINQTSDNIIYIKNNYTVEVFLEFSNDTSLQNILLQPGGLEVINLQQSVYYNETLLTFKVNTTEAFHSKELSLIYKEMLTGFDVNYKESVLINKEYNITATVLSGSNVTINFSILSPADDNSLTKNLLTSNSENEKNAQFLFRPRFDTNYTILMAAKSYCEEVLEQVIRISVAYPEMCPMPVNKNLKIVTDTLLDPHNKPVCVKDWFDDKHFITEIHMDLITDDFDGYVLVKNDSTELVQHLTTIGNYQNMENNQTILVIILSCFQNNEHQGNEIFNKSIYLLHNVSNTHDIIIYVKNDYLVEVFLDLSCETNSQTTLLPPGCLHSINLGSSIFYNAPIQLNFTVNATKKFLSRNLNLIHKEILSGLNMEYKASVLIGKEYNITATLFSGSNVNINFSISPANDDALKRNLEASNVNNDKIFHFTFEPKLETNYTISVAAEYICEDVLTEIIKISAKFPEMCFFNENGKVSNMTGIFTDVTYKQPVCVKDWNDKQAVLTEIFLDLTHGIDYGFVLVQNDSTKAVEFLISHFKNQHPEAQTKLSFKINATREFSSRNLSLIHKEILSDLDIEYRNAVLIWEEYYINATVLSGSDLIINASILSPIDDVLMRYSEPVCCNDWDDQKTVLTEIYIDVSTGAEDGILIVHNDTTEAWQFLTSHAKYQNPGDNQAFVMIVLSCFQNMNHEEYKPVFNDTIYILHNFNQTYDIIIYVRNDYLVDVYLETNSQIILILPGGLDFINLGNSIAYNAQIKLSFLVNATKEFHSRNLSLNYKEILSGLYVDYPDAVLIGNEYNITATLFSGSNVNINFSILSPVGINALTRTFWTTSNMSNDKTAESLFIPDYESNYTILVEAISFCEEHVTRVIIVSVVFPEVILEFSNETKSQTTIIAPGETDFINLGNYVTYTGQTQFIFKVRNNNTGFLTRKLTLIYKETLFGLDVEYRDAVVIGQEYNITAAVFSGKMCPRHENKTASNVTDILANHSDIHKAACITDLDNQSSYIAEISIDLTSDSNGGIVFVKNVSSEVLKNLSGSAHCENPGEVPMIVLIVLTCTETFRTGSQDETAVNEFNETVFMLQNTTCERVLYFQNNYLAEVRLRISDASSQDLIIEPNSLNSIILNSSVLYDYTNLTFSLRTSKESHITNISLKYEALQDLKIYYNSSILVGDVHNITASAISGSVVDFSFKVISLDDTSAAYIKKNEAILGVKSWIQFTAFQELNFTIEVVAKSVCGENITKFIVISAVYPDLCIYNETSMSQSKSMANSKPSCMMDLSEYNRTATQIYMDLTSEERTSYAIISNYSMDIFNNITSSLTCNSSTTRENFLLFNIILSCPQSFYEPVSIGENGETIYILQTIKNICGHGFYIINSYNDTQVKVINGSMSLAKNVLPEKFITTPIKDAIILTFNLTYHKKLYNKNITLKFHEVMTDLTIQYDSEMLVGIPHNVTALVSTGTEISFEFEILFSDNNELMPNNSFTVTKTEDKIAVLEFTPNFVGAHIVAVTARSFCMEKFNKTVNFVSQLCSNGTSALDLSNNKSNSPLCIVSWGDNPRIITEFTMDLQLKRPIGYKYQINTTTNFTLSTECKGKKGVAFKIILNCFSISLNGVDDSSWFNSDIYIKKGITYPSCEELAVIYNNYTINISVQYTVLSQNLTTQQLILPPKSFTNITLVASFSSVSLKFSMLFAKQPLIKNLNLIHFDELSGLSVSFVSEVEVGSIWNITASMASGAGINFTLLISTPENSISTEVNNYTIHYINNKTAQLSYIPPVDGKYNITVVATSMCGEVLSKTVSIFAYYSIQYSELDTLFEITHRKDQGVFYPKDIVGIAFKVMDKVLRDKRPTLPNCTIHWGDESRAILEENVDLTPNPSTGYIYVRNHSYTSLGQYTVYVECHNAISKVEGIENFTIVSPVIHADVVLLKSLVPFDNSTSQGIGTVQLIQKYLDKDCPDFTITLDFNVSGSNSMTFLKDYFIYTYNYSEKGEYDIRVEIGAFGVNKTFSFSIRVGYLMMLRHVKQRKLIRIKEPATFKLVRYPLNETLDVEINMDDESQIIKKQFDIGQTTIDITITYMNEARRIAVAKILVDTYTEVEIYTFDTLIPCISTLDFFDATYRDTSSPLEAWLTTLPIISGRAERTVDCNFTHILSMHWEVSKKNDSVADNWSSMIFDQPNAIVLNFNFIKAIGLYKIHLQISVNRKNETESDTMYLIVTYPPLSVKIKYGAFKQIRLNNNITLDGKSETKDLAEIYVKNTTFLYEWTCYLLSSKNDIHKYTMSLKNNMSLVNLTRCSISLNQTEGIIIVPTSKFALNDLALFLVTVKKDERSGIAGQVAEMCDFAPVDVIIECLWNCGEKLVTDERTVLEAKILNADIRDIKTAQYSWSVSKYGLAGLENVNTTNYFGTDREIFDTDGGWWEEGVTYSISVEVTMDHYNTSKAIRMVFTNFKPYGGNCSVEPLEGIATETSFMFKFPGWKDEGIASEQNSTQDSNFGLQYKVHQKTSAGFHLVYAGNEVSATTYLTECTKEAFGDCQVLIYVIDMFGAKVHYNVQSQLISDSTLFFSVVDKKLNSSLMMGDSMKIAQRAATLSAYVSTAKNDASLNNSTAATTTTVAPLTSSKEEIVNRSNSYVDVVGVLVENNTRSSGQIQILANSLAIVTSGIELMTTKSMETASGALKTLTKSLTNIPVELSSLLPCLDGLKDLVDNIVEVQHLESKKLYSYLNKNYDGYTAEQTQKLIEMEEKALKAEEHVKLQQFENVVKNVTTAWDDYFQVVKKMADSDGKYETEKENFKLAMQKVTIENILNQTSLTPPLGFTFDGTSDRVNYQDLLDKVHVKLTNLTGTAACSCEHGLEVVSGMSFNLFPNTIHFATVFSKFDIKGQGLVIGVLLGLYLLFTLISLWAHYMDRKAMFQWGVFPLVDNYAYDNYFYLITVHTGLRKSAGTTSNVNFTLSGESVDSGIRKLSDGVKKGFPAGSVCHFVMASSASLGELQCIKIWHDSSGLGSNSSCFYFICDEWLAPEYGIVKMVEASNIEDLEKLKNLFFSNTKDHITDDHMWVSLFIRPEKSNFSRVERAVCCLAFLLLSMITSAMFYKDVPGVDRKQAKADFEMGFIRISFEQLYHSLVSAVITAIPMIFVMMVFRKARHIKKEGGYCCNRKKDDIERKQKTYGVQEPGLITVKKKTSFTLPWMAKLEKQLEALEKILLISPTSHNLHETWPHQFRYFAWVILISAIVTSSFFILLYSMEWGKDITETWMSTFFLTFLQSLFVVDPIKVIAISVIVSIILRKAKVKNVDQLDLQLIAQVNKQYGVKEKFSQLDMSYAPPLAKTELRAATLKRKIHIMLNTLLKEFIIHFVYLVIVASLCHASRSPGDYQMYNVINEQLITDPKDGFLQINSTTEFLKWIPETLTPWLFPNIEEQKNYFPDNTFYTNVKDLYRFGTPRIRQLRMMKGNCSTQKIKLKDCVPVYSFTEEETGNYCPGWKRECSSGEQTDFTNAWIYQKAQDIWGLPIAGEYGLYNGGGYIAVLRFKDTIDQIYEDLKRHTWIDRQTRAVFIELTLYCPNINHFIFIILLAEFIETGDVIPFFSMYPFTVHYPPGMMGTYLQLCQIVGTIFTFIACMYVVFIISKKKCSSLKDFWFLLDLAAVITAISAAAMMFLRLKFTNLILSKIKEDRAQFVNMYHVVVWDWAYTLCLAILIAIGCLRLLKLASYSETTMKVYLVLSKAIAILPNFCIFIILILLSFVFFGWITFGPTSTYFKSFWSTTETMFTGILGRSSFKDTNSPVSDRWINIIFFCLFVWIVVIFLINFFLAVLMNLLKDYEQNLAKGENTKVFILLSDTVYEDDGSKRNPLDEVGNDEISDSEEEISVIPVDKTISLFEKRFIKVMST
ncbi:hypothetical protein Btru_073502, partial [Bulinus truncatus]